MCGLDRSVTFLECYPAVRQTVQPVASLERGSSFEPREEPAVTAFALCPVVVLCGRCACVCINVRVVICGISRQRGHHRGTTGHLTQPSDSHHDRLSEEEDSAAPHLRQQEEHIGEAQVTMKSQ